MRFRVLPIAAASTLIAFQGASAAPYASAVTESGGNVSFILNESADSVRVVLNSPLAPLDLGALAAGTHIFPKGSAASYSIEVEKSAGPGWKSGVLQQISDDTSSLVKFANGLGIAVNRKPDTGRLFGRVYVSVGSSGTAAPITSPVSPSRSTGDGIYVLNPDLSGSSLGTDVLTGGLSWTSSTASPFRLTVGDKGDLFIADWSDSNGSVYKTDGDVANGKNILGGPVGASGPTLPDDALHGSIAAVVTEGSEADHNLKLWVIDEDLQTDKSNANLSEVNGLWAWDSGGDPLPMLNPPTLLNTEGINYVTQYADLVRAPDGTFYKAQRRIAGNESAFYAVAPDGTTLVSAPASDPPVTAVGSRGAFQAFSGVPDAADPFQNTRALDLSDDGWLALMRNDNAIHLVKVSAGVIDFSSYILLYPQPTTAPPKSSGNDISFDAAGNLYSLSAGQALLRVYAPGGHTRATTTSTGTFTIAEVTPTTPAPPIEQQPVVTNITQSGADYVLKVFSRLGVASTLKVQQSPDVGDTPWSDMTVTTEYTITGDPPNFTVTIIGAAGANTRNFYRIRRL